MSDEVFTSIACLCGNQLKVNEFHFSFVHLHSATQAKHYLLLQPGGGAGSPPPGILMSFKLCWITNVPVIFLEAGHSSSSCVCVCMCLSMVLLVCFHIELWWSCVGSADGNPPYPHDSKMKLFIERIDSVTQ